MLLNISCSLDSRLVFQFPMAIGKTPTAREKTYIYTVVAGNLNYCTHINICWTACFYWQIASYLIGLIPFFAKQISIILLQPPFLQVRLNLTGTHMCFTYVLRAKAMNCQFRTVTSRLFIILQFPRVFSPSFMVQFHNFQ